VNDSTGLPMLEPNQFASLIAQATDEQIAEGLAANGELIVAEIFNRWPNEFDPVAAGDANVLIQWQIKGIDGGVDQWQIAIRDGACAVEHGGSAEPDVSFRVGAVEFVKLIAGVESGPKLFVFGKMKIRGNLMLAARVQSFFRVPTPD
jgi:putative sterol carrier protein